MSSDEQREGSSHKPIKHRSVVSCFIFKFPEKGDDAKPLVALFKRSDKVRTYRHHLAPISGSIETTDASPLAAAYRELNEETTLPATSLPLFRQGKPYSFSDESIGRSWTIYPFAFILKSKENGGRGEEDIKIDWEHDSWGWHDPGDVVDDDKFGGVPKLKESLRRVWFEEELGQAGVVLARGLNVLRQDHESGARQLAGIALDVLKDVINAMEENVSVEQWWESVRTAGWHVWKNGRESMGAAILSVVIAALSAIEPLLQNTVSLNEERKQQVLQKLDDLVSKRTSTTDRINDALTTYLRKRTKENNKSTISILTLSSSSTIRTALLHAILAIAAESTISFNIQILESRPLYEGVSMASSMLTSLQAKHQTLGSSKVRISIHTDSSVAHASLGLDILLIGADRISEAGDVSNKTGSLPAALAAKHVSPDVQVVVLSELEKVAEPGGTESHVVEENDPSEVFRGWKEDSGIKGSQQILSKLGGDEKAERTEKVKDANVNVKVRNVYFEWVPKNLIDVYVCEEGIWEANGIRERSQWIGEEVERMFGKL